MSDDVCKNDVLQPGKQTNKKQQPNRQKNKQTKTD